MAIIREPGASAAPFAVSRILNLQDGVEGDVEQQPREHRRDRRRTLGVRVGQPRVQRREPDLGAVSQQEENEGQIEQRRIE